MLGRLGNFELVEEIGSGAWGRVYKARQLTLGGRLVAVKTLWPQLAAEQTARQRFLDEARNQAQLRHPHIVKVIDVGHDDDTYYFAMDLVEGETLAELMARTGPLPPEQVAEYGAQMAEALSHAHGAALVHRDVKPGNIMIDTEGRVAVTDFGIAKVGEGSGLTRTGAAIGTPEYMSPEQAQGNPLDGRSDLYSLGVVLYQMVTGSVPFTGPTPVSVGMKHVSEAAQDPRRLRPDCPEWLAALIVRAMAKQPYERFAGGEEMAAALRAGRAAQPATPAPQPAVAPQPAQAAPAQVAEVAPVPPAGKRIAAVPLLAAAIVVVICLMLVGLWVRGRPGGLAAVVRRGGGSAGGGGGGSGMPGGGTEDLRADVIATINKLHQAISDHDPEAAVACFTESPDGAPPYRLDAIASYQGVESSQASDFRELARSGDRASIECTVIVQGADEYFTTDFAYELKREDGAWLIERASLLGETKTNPGRYSSDDG